MSSNQNHSEKVIHPFGGCNRLLSQYHTIGHELLLTEGRRGDSEFREGVSFVSVEVLDSYLEDLLNPEVRDDMLFIVREKTWTGSILIPLLGLLFALGGGLYAASIGKSLPFSFALTLGVAFPFALVLQLFPRQGLMRRMRFAQILSSEISRRRGGDKNIERWPSTTRLLFGDVLRSTKPGSAQGAARQTVH